MAARSDTTMRPVALPEIERTVSALGAKVAKARAERGWSLAELARRAGVSPGAVHKIEKSGMTPTIASLMKIAAALGKSVGHFVDEDGGGRTATVIRAGERGRLYTSKEGLVLENVSGRYGPFLLAGAEARVEPHASSGPEPMTHPGEELLILREGRMRFTVDGEVHDLEPGDSIHFRTVCPHSWSNPSDREARALWLVVRSS
jgi:transcriptional regulator with XRE-family HTH domain